MSQILASTQTEHLQTINLIKSKIQKSVQQCYYLVHLQQGLDGYIIASCPALNFTTQGKTQKEAMDNAKEAAELMVEELGKSKDFSLVPVRTKKSV